MQHQNWRPNQYNTHASFVSSLGSPVVDLLQPQRGERILDLGCGDGTLAAKIESVGAKVIGVDSSPEMVEAARGRGIEAYVMSGDALTFNGEFDAVFSNAALHWMKNYPAVIRGVDIALKPGGRFVGEFGAEGNIQRLISGMEASFARNSDFGTFKNPWFFPSESTYTEALCNGGFAVDHIVVIPRPTPLTTGVREWLQIFADHVVSGLTPEQAERFLAEVEDDVRAYLYTPEGGWFADYVRLRFAARKATS
jgi:trans-aconitate methyltransferase